MQEGVRTSCPGNLVGVSKETRKERVPVARAFVEVREKPGGRGYLCPGDLVGGSKGDQEREGSSSPGFCCG